MLAQIDHFSLKCSKKERNKTKLNKAPDFPLDVKASMEIQSARTIIKNSETPGTNFENGNTTSTMK